MIGLAIIGASIVTGLGFAFLLSPLIVGALRVVDRHLTRSAASAERGAIEVPHV